MKNAYAVINQTQMGGNLDQLLVYTSTNLPVFPAFLLMFIFAGVFGATYFGSKRFMGEPPLLPSLLAGSLTASLVATAMTLTPGIIASSYLWFSWAVTIVLGIYFMWSGRD
jgi:hypothetical protein